MSDFMCLSCTIEKVVRGKNRSFPGVKKAVKAWKGRVGNLNRATSHSARWSCLES